MSVVDIASGLVQKVVLLATEEVIQTWNLHDDLETLRKRLESIDALLSDANTRNLTMPAVQNWFNKLEALANVADVFMDELAYEVTRKKVEDHHAVRNFFIPSKNSMLHRLKVAHKIKSIHTSFDNIFKVAGDLGLQPIAHLSFIAQPREIRNTPPFEDEAKIVGRDDDISYLVQTVCKNHEQDLQAGHDQFNHISQAIYVRVDEGVSDIKPHKNFERVQILFAGTRILADVLPYLKHLTVLVLNADEVTDKLPSSLGKMKYLKHLDISCSRYRLPSYITELYNLQTLRVWDLDELPKKFCNLINLRHLYIEKAYPQKRCVFTGIERLTCIQTLPHFVVSKDKMCLVRQLKELKNLRGKLEALWPW
ncbi:hypothetical protein ACET3Z_026307 [Daucus carota]